MKWLTRRRSPICFAMLLAALFISNRPADAGTIPGATTQSTSEVIASLRHLSQQAKLELSTFPTSATDRFNLLCFANGSAVAPVPIGVYVVRNRENVAMVVASFNGEYIYSYVTNGLLLAVDHDNPAALVRLRGPQANPAFTFGAEEDGTFSFEVGANDDKPKVSFCPGALIDQIIPAIVSASIDPKTLVYSIRTHYSTAHIQLFPPYGKVPPFPISRFALISPSQGFGAAVTVLDASPPPYSEILRDPHQIDEAVDQAGVKIVDLSAKDANEDHFWVVPPEMFPNGRYANTSDALRLILLGEACTSGDKSHSNSAPSETSGDKKYKELCRQFTEAGHLRLSSSSDSCLQKFLVVGSLRTGHYAAGGYDLVFMRDGDQNAVALYDVWGRPYMYMADGYMVAVDMSHLGGLVMSCGMSPQLSISRPGRDYDDLINPNLRSGLRGSSEMDVTELIAPYLKGVRRIDYERRQNVYLFAGDNGMGRVTFRTTDSESPLRIKAFKLYRINNKDLWFDAEIESPAKMEHISLTPQAVAKAGIPVRGLGASEAVALPDYVPENHDLPPGYLAASKVLGTLIPKQMLVPEDAQQEGPK